MNNNIDNIATTSNNKLRCSKCSKYLDKNEFSINIKTNILYKECNICREYKKKYRKNKKQIIKEKDNLVYCYNCNKYFNKDKFSIDEKTNTFFNSCNLCRNNNIEYQKEYRKNNNDYFKEYGKEYRKNNIENINKYQKEYRENNIEKINEKNKKYRENNRDLINKKNNTLRSKLLNKINDSKINDKKKEFTWNEDDYINLDFLLELYEIYENNGFKCYYYNECNNIMNLFSIDRKGTLTIERLDNKLPHLKSNCQFSCYSCNCKHTK